MISTTEQWSQTDFNRWVAFSDDVVTYKEVVAEAEIHGLDAQEAILFANLFPGGEGL